MSEDPGCFDMISLSTYGPNEELKFENPPLRHYFKRCWQHVEDYYTQREQPMVVLIQDARI